MWRDEEDKLFVSLVGKGSSKQVAEHRDIFQERHTLNSVGVIDSVDTAESKRLATLYENG